MEKVKRMKKFNAIVCILTLLCALVVPSSVSASAGESNVVVVCSDEFSVVNKFSRAIPEIWKYVPEIGLDLGVSTTYEMNIKNLLKPSENFQSDVYYTTNSSKIVLRMKSNIKNTMRITIYNKVGAPIGQTTLYAPATITFTNLNSIDNYFFTYENVGLNTVNIGGTVAPK